MDNTSHCVGDIPGDSCRRTTYVPTPTYPVLVRCVSEGRGGDLLFTCSPRFSFAFLNFLLSSANSSSAVSSLVLRKEYSSFFSVTHTCSKTQPQNTKGRHDRKNSLNKINYQLWWEIHLFPGLGNGLDRFRVLHYQVIWRRLRPRLPL